MAESDSQAEQVEIEDPFDVGDTELPLTYEKPDPVEKKVPPKDPETGKFVSPKKHDHPDFLVEEALEFGLSEEDMAGMTTAALGRTLRTYRNQINKERQAQAHERTVQQAEVRAPKEKDPEQELIEELGEGVKDYDDSARGIFRKLLERTKAAEAKAKAVEDRDTVREQSRAADILDDAFESLGSKWAKHFGDKPMGSLGDSPEAKRRIAALRYAGLNLQNADRTTKRKLAEAVAELYPDQPEAEEAAEDPYAEASKSVKSKAKPAVSKEAWVGGAVNRPTQRRGAREPNGEEKAIQNLERKFREEERIQDSEIMNGLPD